MMPDEMERFGKILEAGMKLKAVMKQRGITAARAKCPFCTDGFLHGRVAGRKNHLRMYCDGCTVQMME